MPTMGTLTLADQAAVNQTFSAVSASGGAAKWANRAAGSTLAGQHTITMSVKDPTSPNAAHRIAINFRVPTEQYDAGGINVIGHSYSTASVVFNISQNSALVERLDLYAFVRNFLANGTVDLALDNVEPFY